jgi:aspartyl-tRNA(Asn)/glutamyl-tRNA(Gln) amidotransferase subunit B
MRSKEDAQDYRYFPDPDLPALILSEERVNRIREELPELPDQKCSRFQEEYGLPKYDAELISSESELSEFYELAVSKTDGNKDQAKLVSNWLIGELFAFLNRENLTIGQSPISAENLASLTKLISGGVISSKIAKEVFEHMWESGESPDKIVKDKGLVQISDEATIRQEIMSVLSANEDKVAEYRSGKEKLFGFFVGQIMKKTGGKLNPKMLNEILTELLNNRIQSTSGEYIDSPPYRLIQRFKIINNNKLFRLHIFCRKVIIVLSNKCFPFSVSVVNFHVSDSTESHECMFIS